MKITPLITYALLSITTPSLMMASNHNESKCYSAVVPEIFFYNYKLQKSDPKISNIRVCGVKLPENINRETYNNASPEVRKAIRHAISYHSSDKTGLVKSNFYVISKK